MMKLAHVWSPLLLLFIQSLFPANNAFTLAPSIASQYSLSTSTSLPFPTATLSNVDTQSLLTSSWSLSQGRIQDGSSNLAFVPDPFPNFTFPSDTSGSSPNNSSPVLQVTYLNGGFGSTKSGSQMESLWNSSTGFQTMLLSYEVAFDVSFPFVKGGKLPGLRGGPQNTCSGGDLSNGTCFSTRLMWRTNGAGEVYAYMLTPGNMCVRTNFICNSDFGISISRGAFTFKKDGWNRISMLVRLNSSPNTANGLVQLYFDDTQVISQPNLQFSNTQGLTIGGLFFSTFFGGNDPSWAPSSDTHTYFRNVQLWGSFSPSNLTATSDGVTAFSVSWSAGITLLVVYLVQWVGVF